MSFSLEKFEIKNLNCTRNISLRFKENKLILVGENGSGKTTICRILYYFLTRDWSALDSFSFEELRLSYKFNTESRNASFSPQKLLSSFLDSCRDGDEEMLYLFSRFELNEIAENDSIGHVLAVLSEGDQRNVNEHRARRPMSGSMILRMKEELKQLEAFRQFLQMDYQLKECFENHVVYLPTYRRIEEDMESLIAPVEENGPRRRVSLSARSEMIQFGMQDVDDALTSRERSVKDYSQFAQNSLTLSYLHHIVSGQYREFDIGEIADYSNNEAQDVLSRISEGILNQSEKTAILNSIEKARDEQDGQIEDEATRIILHYFTLLKKMNDDLSERELAFIKFAEICNSYLRNSTVHYDKQQFRCEIEAQYDNQDGISRSEVLRQLSSGEKQIVALFSKLNIEDRNDLLVLIDEPELSLSINWQRRFLPDVVASRNCCGLLATTHSPFIFDNDLISYVYGINEFDEEILSW